MPESRTNVERVVAALNLSDIFAHLFDQPIPAARGGEVAVRCIFHDDSNPSLSLNLTTGLFYCHGCQARGDVFSAYMAVHRCEFPEALDALARRAGVILSGPRESQHPGLTATSAVMVGREAHAAAEQVLAHYQPPAALIDPSVDDALVMAWHETLVAARTGGHFSVVEALQWLREKRLLDDQTVIDYRLGWDGQRLTIPVYDATGVCRNIRRYDLLRGGGPKMLNYRRGFGSARTYPNLTRDVLPYATDTPLVIVEGELDALLARQDGLVAMSVTGGAGTWKDTWSAEIANAGVGVLLCYDADDAGLAGAWRVAKSLMDAGVVEVQWFDGRTLSANDAGKDYTDWRRHHLDPRFLAQSIQTLAQSVLFRTTEGTLEDIAAAATARMRERARGDMPTPTEDVSAGDTPPAETREPPTETDATAPPDLPPGAVVTYVPPEDGPGARYRLDDIGNAERLVAQHGDDLRYMPGVGWLVWDGVRYEPDEDKGAATERAKRTARSIFGEATALMSAGDATQAELMRKHARASASHGRLKAMVDLARSTPSLLRTPDDMDADPLLLGVPNGVVDLRTGTVRPARRSDEITRAAAVAYDPTATCPRWVSFVNEIMHDSADLVSFLHKAIGYALTGETREQVFFMLWGSGANGKSTLLDTLAHVLGPELCRAMPFAALSDRPRSGPSEDVARLYGARLVTAVETAQGQRLNEAIVKQLTGGDRIAARHLYMNTFEYRPTFKLWLATNHRPTIRDTSHGLWRRLRLVPFTQRFSDDPDVIATGARVLDATLGATLAAERPGILRWAVDGAMRWLAEGLGTPPEVREAVESYRQNEDDVGGFVAARCHVGGELSVAASELYQAYTRWCEETSREPITQTAFGRRLTEAGYPSRRGRGGAMQRHGLTTIPEGELELDEDARARAWEPPAASDDEQVPF